MDALSADVSFIMEKKESTYGTDAAPAAATDAILARNINITPLDGNPLVLDYDQPYDGARPSILTARHVSMGFEFDVAASGTSGAGITAPAWSSTLQSCGFDENDQSGDVGNERFEYTPSSMTNQLLLTSVSSAINYNEYEHRLLGARGGWSLNFGAQGFGSFTVSRKGLYVAPSNVVFPTPVYTAWQTPLSVDNDNTPTITLDGYACTLFSLQLSGGSAPEILNVPGGEMVVLGKRNITGSIEIALPAFTSKNFFALAELHSQVVLALVHGNAGGEIVQIDAAQCELRNPRYGAQGNIRTLTMDISLIPSAAGNDELMITTK